VDFGYMLRTLRVSADIGLRELSRMVDISPTYLSLIENGKQAPPNAVRITKIEEALNVPPGSLLCVAQCYKSDINTFFETVPEAVDFLNVARESAMSSSDFMDLTAFLSFFGRDKLRGILQAAAAQDSGSPASAPPRSKEVPYIWPFLKENLIFDVSATDGKESFIRDIVSRIAGGNDGLDVEKLLSELLDREALATTGIGHGIAVPHAYFDELDHTLVSFTRIPGGLDFDAIDGKPVFMALLMAGPHADGNLHLRLLARVAKLMHHKHFCDSILNAPGAADIISIFRLAEMRIP